jgi:DNA-binding MurR/RpiR family transcriptional regulator
VYEIGEAFRAGVRVITVTDSQRAPLAPYTAAALVVPRPCVDNLISVASTMCLCQALFTALAERLELHFDETEETGEYDD